MFRKEKIIESVQAQLGNGIILFKYLKNKFQKNRQTQVAVKTFGLTKFTYDQ